MDRLRTAFLVAACGVFTASASFGADLAPSLAQPAEPGGTPLSFFVHVGPSGVFSDESARLRTNGAPLPGANISIDDQAAFAVETGIYLNRNVAISFTGGVPFMSKIEGAGSLAGSGTAGKALNGPMAVELQYHFTEFGRVQPYLGVGPVYLWVMNNKDGTLSGFTVRDSLGVSLQAGIDFMLDEHWGVFVDIKKAILRTNAVGYLGPVRVDSRVVLDPVALHSGVTYRF